MTSRKSGGSSSGGAKRPASAKRTTAKTVSNAKRTTAARRPASASKRSQSAKPGATRSRGSSAGTGKRSATGRPAPRRPGSNVVASRPRQRRRVRLATGHFRLWSAFVAVAFVLSLFAARLVQLQGIDENDYAAMAASKGAKTITLEAPRAGIYDRDGVVLAESIEAAKLTADPTLTGKYATRIATYLHERIGADYIEMLTLLRKPNTQYAELARHLDPKLAESILDHFKAVKIPGMYTDKDTQRIYPEDDVAANLIGWVGADNSGLGGLEWTLDSELAGKDGSATFETTAGGVQLPLADRTVKKPVEGTGVRLTIDRDLQFLAQRRVAQAVRQAGGASGTAVVMDVKTGDILALADYPTFDPNQWKQSAASDRGSRSVQDPYEPGSVEKPLTFAALIDAGYVTPKTKIKVPGTLQSGTDTIHDWWSHGPIRLTATGAIAQSSNIATVRAARQMPSKQLHDYLTSFGLGRATNLGLDGESAGKLPKVKDWIQISKDNIAFGQGLSVNAVQMGAAISAIANGGVYVEPSLVEAYVEANGDVTPAKAPEEHRVVSEKAAHEVARMMEAVVGENGLAPMANINGYRVAGKTGTAQAVDPSCGCYNGRKVVSFAGFAPADAPRFMVYVVVKDPRASAGGGSTGGPVFHDLMAAALQKFGVPPTGMREPAYPVYW